MIDIYHTRLGEEEKWYITAALEYLKALFLLDRNGFDISSFPWFYEDDFFCTGDDALKKILTLPKGVELVDYDQDTRIVPGKSAVYFPIDEDPEVIYKIVAADEQKAEKLSKLARSLFRTIVEKEGCDVTVIFDRYELPFLLFPVAVYAIVASRLIKKEEVSKSGNND